MLRQTFISGRMNQDADIRLLPKGEYREAYGIEIINSEGSDVGAIEPMLSNKKLTSYNVGANPLDMGDFADEFRKKIYWLVLSDLGSFLFEWDDTNKIQSLVLGDTRPEATRVFSLKKENLITAMVKVTTQNIEDDLLLFTDDNMQPICINIERAKSWGINGFVEEDILLIKKPPRYAPKITPTYTNDGSNNLEERFFLFATRFRYLDGEYSAPSDFTNYNFNPKPFNLDYFTLDNKGMINAFNAVKIDFNTGEKQVTEIQLLVKESLSNSLNVIETFSKEAEGWGDNLTKSFVFSNNKTITPLPDDQLLRLFDNVPLKAKALSLIENIPVFSNYLEGYDLKDEDGNDINIDYNIALQNNIIESGDDFNVSVVPSNKAKITNPNNYALSEGRRIIIDLSTEIDGLPGYDNSFFHTLDAEYPTLNDVFQSLEFQNLLEVINSDFQNNFNQAGDYTIPPTYTPTLDPEITYALEGGIATFTISPATFTDSDNGGATVEVPVTFAESTNFGIVDDINSGTCKTNRNYEVGVVYMDKYGRRSTVLTSKNNTLFIPQEYSVFQNKLVATINSKVPYWADRYKLVVKSTPLAYQTLYITEFYNDDFFTWCKLEGKNKDKISIGDFLIIKKAGDQIITEPIKIKVLDIKEQADDFIKNNTDENDNDIIERGGLYMKIRPTSDFSMDRDDFDVDTRESPVGSNKDGFPRTILDLFTSAGSPDLQELAIPAGTSITLQLNSSRNYDAGWKNINYDNEFYTQRDYNTIEEWFKEIILKRFSLKADDGSGEFDYDYLKSSDPDREKNMELFRDENGYLKLIVWGLLSGGTRNRRGRVSAKIIVRTGSGVYAFETLPKQADTNAFFETAQCFDIINGNHTGNTQDQYFDNGDPAIIEMDFFNCYTQGNGIESYRVRDEFNTNYLSIDTRPSATSVEEYRAVRRFADMTYGKAYIESTNINGLNEFNLSLANFKELDKHYGSIQKTINREGDILVLQEEKAGYVLFGKDLLATANGEMALKRISEILGQYMPYAGHNGIGNNPESVAIDGNRVYWVNARRGTPVRLSIDGTTEINYGMVSHFRNLFIQNPTSRKIGGYDPYFKKYTLTIEDEVARTLNAYCGNIIQKTITEPFTYILNINYLLGDTVLNFNVSEGEVNIVATYAGIPYTANGVTGLAALTIPRTDLEDTQIVITITPVSSAATIQAAHTCPTGIPMKVISIVLADESDLGRTMINRYRWGASSFFSEEHLFENSEVSKFVIEEGLEGTAKYPKRGTNVNIQAYKDGANTGSFKVDRENKLGYLISSNNYTDADIATILAEATFIDTTNTQISLTNFIDQASFPFNRPNGDENLYMIWDYRDNELAINADTKIIFAFDGSGSMDGTLAPLETMKDTILKDRLLPLYGNDSALYDASVEVIPWGTGDQYPEVNEQTLAALNMFGTTPEGNVIVMVFQDEASPIYTDGTFDPTEASTAPYDTDLATLRGRLNSFPNNYYRGVIFQVDPASGTSFKDFVSAIQLGTGNYAGANGLSDRNEFNYKYDIADGETPAYYLDKIVEALTELGYNL
ncbi:hypothetical protein [Leeuwenhoekiella aequorea]|uniref:Uncharacterized protein n=1 Tax=Leeuwenhoekiella aequorea TaxID=283736 RepID=A0A4Q0P4U7_9FLAO|nr:hypothetical protein [Leeuwenhoekiella aequorea]RXG21036.1 hypothetical protein DSM00_2550 [Leeuwenhoekiella aequorea]